MTEAMLTPGAIADEIDASLNGGAACLLTRRKSLAIVAALRGNDRLAAHLHDILFWHGGANYGVAHDGQTAFVDGMGEVPLAPFVADHVKHEAATRAELETTRAALHTARALLARVHKLGPALVASLVVVGMEDGGEEVWRALVRLRGDIATALGPDWKGPALPKAGDQL